MADLLRLRSELDESVPVKALDRNLLIATWNVRAFGDLTQKWESSEEDTPKRDLHSQLSIAEIVSRFDVVVAVQGAKDPIPLHSLTFPPVRRHRLCRRGLWSRPTSCRPARSRQRRA